MISESSPRLVVLGLDGATWDLIDPMMEAGELPTLQTLCENGVRGRLQSLAPMQSPDLWTSIATGLPRDKHGIEGYFCTRTDLKVNRVWDVAHKFQLKIGLFSWLVTWPPKDGFEFIVPSWMAHSPETKPYDYTCVQELYLEQSRYGGEIDPVKDLWRCVRQGARLGGVERMATFYLRDRIGFTEEERLAAKETSEVRMRTDLFLSLLRRYQPDVSTFILYGSDKIAHRFWHYMEPEKFPGLQVEANNPYRETIRDYYREADAAFGRILKALPVSCNMMLISDHGFQADPNAPRQFFLNVPNLLKTLGVSRLVHYYTIQRQVVVEPIVEDAFPLDELKETLERIRFDGEEDSTFLVELEEEKRISIRPNFSLSYHEESPILTHPFLVIDGEKRPVDAFFFARTFSGTHHPQGVAIFKGPAFEKGKTIEGAGLFDLAPTMLYLLDLPVSRELPGRILVDAIDEEYRQSHEVSYVDAYGEPPVLPEDGTDMPESLMDHLRSLNYVE